METIDKKKVFRETGDLVEAAEKSMKNVTDMVRWGAQALPALYFTNAFMAMEGFSAEQTPRIIEGLEKTIPRLQALKVSAPQEIDKVIGLLTEALKLAKKVEASAATQAA
jgi:hypothetical protein